MTVGGVSPVPREARPFQGEVAGVVSRLIANVIDGVVVALVLVGGYLGFNGVLFLVDPRRFQFTGANVFASVATASVAMLLYFTATWATTGRTYGNHVMGLRVVKTSMGNVPRRMFNGSSTLHPKQSKPETAFYKR